MLAPAQELSQEVTLTMPGAQALLPPFGAPSVITRMLRSLARLYQPHGLQGLQPIVRNGDSREYQFMTQLSTMLRLLPTHNTRPMRALCCTLRELPRPTHSPNSSSCGRRIRVRSVGSCSALEIMGPSTVGVLVSTLITPSANNWTDRASIFFMEGHHL